MPIPEKSSLPIVEITRAAIFPGDPRGSDSYLKIETWPHAVTYFVGRNGSGKSRAAKQVAEQIAGRARMLATDRLLALTSVTNWGWTMKPDQASYKGVPIGDEPSQHQIREQVRASGMAMDEIYALREHPDIAIEVAAFIRRVFGRTVELREAGGYIDPVVRVGSVEYSLLRDEGHGLKELVVLLVATYRRDWNLLVVDEPELHLHPSAVRVWRSEIDRICSSGDRRAIVVTHEPGLVQPSTYDELESIVFFSVGKNPVRIGEAVLSSQAARVSSSIKKNRAVTSQLVFSPRPVLVEGLHDVAALNAAISRIEPANVVAQTDLVNCGGSSEVALWLEISQKLGIDVKAIADLDVLFSTDCPRAMESIPQVVAAYRGEFNVEPPLTRTILAPIQARMSTEKVPADPASKRTWMAQLHNDGHANTRDKLLKLWQGYGLWLHPEGRLEDVLGLSDKASVDSAASAAEVPGAIDAVARWCAYRPDASGDAFLLLEAAVERIAHRVQEALKLEPEAQYFSPVGANSSNEADMVSVEAISDGKHRITVRQPERFSGYQLTFDRTTPPNEMMLRKPSVAD